MIQHARRSRLRTVAAATTAALPTVRLPKFRRPKHWRAPRLSTAVATAILIAAVVVVWTMSRQEQRANEVVNPVLDICQQGSDAGHQLADAGVCDKAAEVKTEPIVTPPTVTAKVTESVVVPGPTTTTTAIPAPVPTVTTTTTMTVPGSPPPPRTRTRTLVRTAPPVTSTVTRSPPSRRTREPEPTVTETVTPTEEPGG